MSENWTKGPWKYEPNKDNFGHYGEDRIHGCTIMGGGWHIARIWNDIEEYTANAHLIAAAPRQYAALEGLLKRYIALAESGDCGFWNPHNEPEVIEAIAALKQARGEA